MKREQKIKIIIVTLLPILIGVTGCYIYTSVLISTVGYGKEGWLAGAVYMMLYIFGFMPCFIVVAAFSLLYNWMFLHRLRHKLGAILFFLLFLILLIIVPEGVVRR